MLADKKGISSDSGTSSEVQNALRRGAEILRKTNWDEMLGSPEMNEGRIEEAFRERVRELGREREGVRRWPGLTEAMEAVENGEGPTESKPNPNFRAEIGTTSTDRTGQTSDPAAGTRR